MVLAVRGMKQLTVTATAQTPSLAAPKTTAAYRVSAGSRHAVPASIAVGAHFLAGTAFLWRRNWRPLPCVTSPPTPF